NQIWPSRTSANIKA
ncbi:unnamed protein product, partial [Tilletia controversa]